MDRRVTKKSQRVAPEELNYAAMIISFAVRYVGTNLNDRGFNLQMRGLTPPALVGGRLNEKFF
ncbi:MAG: hypothetical protein HLX49_02540 [Virgibacillus sp.]|nr:hypothetical protein [Virgibacillus sp.]